MDILALLSLAIGPGLLIALFVYFKDKSDPEPGRLLIQAFFLGVFSIVPAIIFEVILGDLFPMVTTDIYSVAVYAFIVVALSEEFSKYFFLTQSLYHHKAFNEPFDGIMYSVMIGMGFATAENLLYVLGEDGGFGTAILRMLTAVPAHAYFGILMGYFVGLAKCVTEKDSRKKRQIQFQYRATGLFAAIIFHGGYDFFLFQQNYPLFAFGALIPLIFGFKLSRNAIRTHAANSPFLPQNKKKKV